MGIHTSEKKHLSAKGLLQKVRHIFEKIPEPTRDSRGLKTSIPIVDCLMSALAIFGLKFPSLLQFDHEQEEKTTRHNLKHLYGVEAAPCDTSMRERLDKLDPYYLRSAFTEVFSALQRGKVLESYQFLGKYLLVPCDGTGVFSSPKVHCDNCCQKHHKDGTTTYYHQLLAGVVVHPDYAEVFPFCPEPIFKADGASKNDCERNAMARFLEHFKREHPHLTIIFTYDALSANGPCIKRIQENGSHFIIGVTPEGNKTLFEWLKGIELDHKEILTKEGRIQLRFYNGVPLNDSHAEIEVNYFECMVTTKKGKVMQFSWITDLEITPQNVYELSRGGRARWRIENETFNTLKNQGYHFEHNYGHGYKHLSHVFAYLMFLAFLIDQVQQKCCALFQAALKRSKNKKRLWRKLLGLFTDFYIESWEDIWKWIAGGHGARMMFDSS